ncbi:hypothetical protein BKA66DRAFT_46201 [Pyrenochaeta sp. MPI-SDFR-AT-0127]|nr:hypothetical protein BKA66DRAFT_46201 [Pyrenochaeta sp. MPI-SDFR-AT-0127]
MRSGPPFTKQDVAGMGAGIHSAQTGFSGLMDNLSISPTASSASIMLRNMGNKLEKGGRFTKRLFKPKSVISVPAADGSIAEPTVGQVLVVSGEAGRQKVNVNTDPGNQVGGGTGYLKVERSSLHIRQTTARVGRSLGLTANESWPRKRIDGEYRERAEVFSLARKGILKRASSIQPPNETPKFSTPSSPNDDLARQVDINGEDCFGSTPQILITRTRSQNTPHGTLKNVTFSSLIQFYDAWSSSDYDRRGDVATCSRLTPMLAQQIKVELNSLKMEMEVHKLHKSHTYII